jgi:hypothetical protein
VHSVVGYAAIVATHPCGPCRVVLGRPWGDLLPEIRARGANEVVAVEAKAAIHGTFRTPPLEHRTVSRTVFSGRNPDGGRRGSPGAKISRSKLAEDLGGGQSSIAHNVAVHRPKNTGNGTKSTAETVACRRDRVRG